MTYDDMVALARELKEKDWEQEPWNDPRKDGLTAIADCEVNELTERFKWAFDYETGAWPGWLKDMGNALRVVGEFMNFDPSPENRKYMVDNLEQVSEALGILQQGTMSRSALSKWIANIDRAENTSKG